MKKKNEKAQADETLKEMVSSLNELPTEVLEQLLKNLNVAILTIRHILAVRIHEFKASAIIEHMKALVCLAFGCQPVDFTAAILVIDRSTESRFNMHLLDRGNGG